MNSDMILFIVMAIVGAWMVLRSTIFTGVKGDRCLAALPFYHTVGFMIGEFYTGGSCFLILCSYAQR